MAKTYCKYEHDFVTVREFEDKALFDIVHKVEGRTWIKATYCHQDRGTPAIVDSQNNAVFDEDGNCILTVEDERCEFWSMEEAENMYKAWEAEEAAYGNWGNRSNTGGL